MGGKGDEVKRGEEGGSGWDDLVEREREKKRRGDRTGFKKR